MPTTRSASPSGSVIGAAGAGTPPSSLTEAAISPPPCSTISWAARYAAASGSCGSTPRSKRLEASERSEEHTSELQSRGQLVCRLLLEKKHVDDEDGFW